MTPYCHHHEVYGLLFLLVVINQGFMLRHCSETFHWIQVNLFRQILLFILSMQTLSLPNEYKMQRESQQTSIGWRLTLHIWVSELCGWDISIMIISELGLCHTRRWRNQSERLGARPAADGRYCNSCDPLSWAQQRMVTYFRQVWKYMDLEEKC